jgi:transposase
MDAVEKLRHDIRAGRITTDRLVDLIASQQRQLHATQQQLEATQQQLQVATKRLEELEKRFGNPSGSTKLAEPYSVRSEEKRQAARGLKRKPKRKGRRGRLRSQDKISQAERTEAIYPDGVPRQECRLSHVRPVWRLENRRAVLIAYEIYRGPHSQYGRIPGVIGRCEFGLEIIVEIAYLVYLVGLSFDKVCVLLQFFQDVKLKKSQANALLYRLARHWEHEFEVLCTLLANSMVVHADETSWSVNSVWVFLSEKARVLLFGVHKDADTLQKVLDPASFAGIVISDHAAVYGNFTKAQKCWAHLLRKAIKLTLQEPKNGAYRVFADQLLEIYREACRVQRDGRLGDAGRTRKVAILDDKIFDLCAPMWLADLPPQEGLDNDFRLVVNEVFDLMIDEQLFTFVTAPPVQQPNQVIQPVAGTNNESERTLRRAAGARETGRANKAPTGARRQSILTSVLESLRVYLAGFTLESVLEEMSRWWKTGQSCFEKLLTQLKLKLPESETPIIDRLLPSPTPSG